MIRTRYVRTVFANLCLCFGLEFYQPVNAQSSVQGNASVHGNVKDSAGNPVASANILILKVTDSALVKATVTLLTGEYSFTNIPVGRYITAATCAGYLASYSSAFEITISDLQKQLETIRLIENRLDLKAVTVVAKKPLLEQKIDRLIINVANSVTSAGSTALQVLERSPGIVVDHQNNVIAMNGKSGVMLMINGKLTRMPVSAVVQLLASMNSDNIEKIELITTPPANLDAEGNAGYINIVLKENNSFGTNGSFSATAGYSLDFLGQASLNINHRKGKMNIYGDLSYSNLTDKMTADSYTRISSSGTINEQYFQMDRISHPTNFDGRIGVDIELSKRTILGLLFSGRDNKYAMDENNNNDIYKNLSLDTVVKSSNDEVNRWTNYGANINLQYDLKKNGKLSINLDYIHYINNQDVNYRKTYYDSSGNFIYPQNSMGNKNTLIDFWIGAADYVVTLSKKVTLETGVKQTFSAFTNDISFANAMGNVWIKDKSLSAKYKLHEEYPAVYASSNINLNERTSLKLGLRYEYTFSNLGTEDIKNIVDRKYGNLFPTLFFSYKLTKNTAVNFSYSKRITRPTFNDLAPFTYFVNPTTVITGNPSLQPSINNTLKADYVFRQYLFSLSIAKETNSITGFQPESDSVKNLIVYSPKNLENTKTITGIISVPVTVNSWWTMQFNLTAIWQQVNANYKKQDLRMAQASVNINANQRFTLPKNYFFELTGFYQSAALDGIVHRSDFGSLDIGFKKTLPGKYGSLSLNVANVLNSIALDVDWDLPSQNLVGDFYLMPFRRNVKLTYSKNFGKDKLTAKRARTTGADDAKSRVQ